MGIGIWEIVVLSAVALVVIGPDKFPEFAKIVVRTIQDLRGYVNDLKDDIGSELRPVEEEVRKLRHMENDSYVSSLSTTKETTQSGAEPDEDTPYGPSIDDETPAVPPDKKPEKPTDAQGHELPTDGYDD